MSLLENDLEEEKHNIAIGREDMPSLETEKEAEKRI